MKRILLTFLTAFAINANAQTHKITCYDLNCGRIKEDYYVNPKGEKNGPYKSFDANGVLAIETSFKNGYMDGNYKEYFNNGGRAELASSETYKEGVLNGQAIYYGGERHTWVVKKGNYVNGKPEGIWTYVEKMVNENDMPEGFKYSSGVVTFKDGEIASRNPTTYFYPSGKIFTEEIKKDSITETREYHPNGKLAIKKIIDNSNVVLSKMRYDESAVLVEENTETREGNIKVIRNKKYWPNGQLKEFTTRKMTFPEVNLYEGYNEDGSKNESMLYSEKKEKAKVKEIEDLKLAKIKARESAEKNLNKLITALNDSISSSERMPVTLWGKLHFDNSEGDFSSFVSYIRNRIERPSEGDTSSSTFYRALLVTASNNAKRASKMDSVANASWKYSKSIEGNYKRFKDAFMGKSEYVGVDRNSQPIYEYPYPQGKNFFLKADTRINELMTEFKNEKDADRCLQTAKKINDALIGLLGLVKTDTSETDRKLRKAKTKEDEIMILGF